MQETLVFTQKERSSRIHIMKDTVIPPLPTSGGLYVCDTNLQRIIAPLVPATHLVVLPAGEQHKSLERACEILTRAAQLGLSRDSLFVGIGGGVITDMTAFAASLYMRGCNLALVPTTLLAMCDAAIGGKTGVDYQSYKNYAGTFYPASDIYICTSYLDILPRYEFLCGMGEVIKTAILFDAPLYRSLNDNRASLLSMADPQNAKNHDLLASIIGDCVAHKCRIVEQDSTESHMRMLLNLGHTFGHALESFCGLGALSHGQAVAWGIGRATVAGMTEHVLSNEDGKNILATLDAWGWNGTTVLPQLSAATQARGLTPEEVATELCALMQYDKKKRSGVISFVIPETIGRCRIMTLSDATVQDTLVRSLVEREGA